MKKKYLTPFVIAIVLSLILTSSFSSYAFDGWEARLIVSAGSAENKLSFGLRPDATDGYDGKYDVSAMLSGDLKAYFVISNSKLWRDIKNLAPGEKKIWTIRVESAKTGEMIEIKWPQKDFPLNSKFQLIDVNAGTFVDMKTISSYSYQNSGVREFKVEVFK